MTIYMFHKSCSVIKFQNYSKRKTKQRILKVIVVLCFITFYNLIGEEVRPRRLCEELFQSIEFSQTPIYIPGKEWKSINNFHTEIKDDKLVINNLKGECVLKYVLPEPIRLEIYKELIIKIQVNGRGTISVGWEDQFRTYSKLGYTISETINSIDERKEFHFYLCVTNTKPVTSVNTFGTAYEFYISFNGDFYSITLLSTAIIPTKVKDKFAYVGTKGTRMPAFIDKEIRWRVKIKKCDILSFATCFGWSPAFSKKASLVSDGVMFTLDAEIEGSKREKLFKKQVTSDILEEFILNGWSYYCYNLNNFAGKEVNFIFQIDNLSSPDGDYAFWGNPMIINTEEFKLSNLPPIILISCDTLRPQNLVTYHYDLPTSYFLDEFSKDAVVFYRSYTPRTHTPVAHMSLLTGLEPERHGVSEISSVKDNVSQINELLLQKGYVTSAFVGFHYWFMPIFGFGKNHDLFSYPSNIIDVFEVNQKALEWLTRYKDHPFFVFLHNYDVHTKMDSELHIYDSANSKFKYFSDLVPVPSELTLDCLPNPPRKILEFLDECNYTLTSYENLFIKNTYDDCIAKVDYALGEFFQSLKRLGIYDKSMIIVVSDHGEALGENGRYEHNNVFENTARIVTMIKFPNNEYGGTQIYELTSLVDIVPTILDYLQIMPNCELDGHSLLPLIRNGTPIREFVVTKNITQNEIAFITKKYKYISNIKEQKDLLFDLNECPQEEKNIAEDRKEILNQLKMQLREIETKKEEGYLMWIMNSSECKQLSFSLYPPKNIQSVSSNDITMSTIKDVNLDILQVFIQLPPKQPFIGKIILVPKDTDSNITIEHPVGREVNIVLPNKQLCKFNELGRIHINDPNLIWETRPQFPEDPGIYFAFQKVESKDKPKNITLPSDVEDTLRSLGYLR